MDPPKTQENANMECILCNVRFASTATRSEMERHVGIRHGKGAFSIYQCSICLRKHYDATHFAEHFQSSAACKDLEHDLDQIPPLSNHMQIAFRALVDQMIRPIAVPPPQPTASSIDQNASLETPPAIQPNYAEIDRQFGIRIKKEREMDTTTKTMDVGNHQPMETSTSTPHVISGEMENATTSDSRSQSKDDRVSSTSNLGSTISLNPSASSQQSETSPPLLPIIQQAIEKLSSVPNQHPEPPPVLPSDGDKEHPPLRMTISLRRGKSLTPKIISSTPQPIDSAVEDPPRVEKLIVRRVLRNGKQLAPPEGDGGGRDRSPSMKRRKLTNGNDGGDGTKKRMRSNVSDAQEHPGPSGVRKKRASFTEDALTRTVAELIREHKIKDRAQCFLCAKYCTAAFNTGGNTFAINLIQHAQSHLYEKYYRCRLCKVLELTIYRFRKHMQTEHNMVEQQRVGDCYETLDETACREMMAITSKCFFGAPKLAGTPAKRATSAPPSDDHHRGQRESDTPQSSSKQQDDAPSASSATSAPTQEQDQQQPPTTTSIIPSILKDLVKTSTNALQCYLCSNHIAMINPWAEEDAIGHAAYHLRRDMALYRCSYCSKEFRYVGSVREHTKSSHSNTDPDKYVDLSREYESELRAMVSMCFAAVCVNLETIDGEETSMGGGDSVELESEKAPAKDTAVENDDCAMETDDGIVGDQSKKSDDVVNRSEDEEKSMNDDRSSTDGRVPWRDLVNINGLYGSSNDEEQGNQPIVEASPVTDVSESHQPSLILEIEKNRSDLVKDQSKTVETTSIDTQVVPSCNGGVDEVFEEGIGANSSIVSSNANMDHDYAMLTGTGSGQTTPSPTNETSDGAINTNQPIQISSNAIGASNQQVDGAPPAGIVASSSTGSGSAIRLMARSIVLPLGIFFKLSPLQPVGMLVTRQNVMSSVSSSGLTVYQPSPIMVQAAQVPRTQEAPPPIVVPPSKYSPQPQSPPELSLYNVSISSPPPVLSPQQPVPSTSGDPKTDTAFPFDNLTHDQGGNRSNTGISGDIDQGVDKGDVHRATGLDRAAPSGNEGESYYKLKFKCDSCDFASINKQQMEEHINVHRRK